MASPFQTVGRCIYCDSTQPPLTREHVVARGLGGDRAPNAGSEAMVLLNASCEQCREITGKFEKDCLNGMFGPARARLDLNRKDRAKPDGRAQIVYRDGRQEKRRIGIGYLPGAMILPNFSAAGVFLGSDWAPPADTKIMQIVIADQQRLRDPNIHKVSVEIQINLDSFARMLSKIGLGVAHYCLGPDAFHPVARDFIRTGDGHPNLYVGGFADTHGGPKAPGTFHSISLWHHQMHLVVTIQLFADAGAPVNYAVIGPIRRMPPGLPPLPLEQPPQHQDKPPDPLPQSDPETDIQWGQTSPLRRT